MQDVFLRCRTKLATVEDPPSYLRRSVINGCHSLRRRLRRGRSEIVGGNAGLPVELVELRDALGRLRPKQRAAVVLRYYADLSYDEIAVELSCRPATARSLVHRAVESLKQELT